MISTGPRLGPLLLDHDGLWEEDARELPSAGTAYTIFAQQSDGRIDASAWQRHATQFFQTDLTLTRPKRYGAVPPRTDAAHIVLTTRNENTSMHRVFVLPRRDEDLEFAERAKAGGGLALLAKRCQTIFLVLTEGDHDDRALRLSAIVASIVLGPILSPDRTELFGVRTARSMLEARVL